MGIGISVKDPAVVRASVSELFPPCFKPQGGSFLSLLLHEPPGSTAEPGRTLGS